MDKHKHNPSPKEKKNRNKTFELYELLLFWQKCGFACVLVLFFKQFVLIHDQLSVKETNDSQLEFPSLYSYSNFPIIIYIYINESSKANESRSLYGTILRRVSTGVATVGGTIKASLKNGRKNVLWEKTF